MKGLDVRRVIRVGLTPRPLFPVCFHKGHCETGAAGLFCANDVGSTATRSLSLRLDDRLDHGTTVLMLTGRAAGFVGGF